MQGVGRLRPLSSQHLAAAALSTSRGPSESAEREVSLEQDGVTLWGTLIRPHDGAPKPAVLIFAGSGPTDRDGNTRLPDGSLLHNNSLKKLATALSARGIASLRVDKRGVARSAALGVTEATLRFSTYVADAQAWATWLSKETGVEAIAFVGHSEGALVATLAAQGAPVDRLVTIAGAGEPAGQLLRRQLGAGGLPKPLLGEAERVLHELQAGRSVDEVQSELAALFRPSVQPYLISWLSIDPAVELGKVEAPVLVVQGTADLQVGVKDAERLAAAHPDADLILIEGMNHVLTVVPAERGANIATYGNPALPLAPGLVDAVADFVLDTAP